MGKLHFLIIATLLICFSTNGEAQVQVTAEKGYLRPTIESYPLAKRRPLLQYLNEARVSANKGMQLLVEGKIDALYEVMLPAFRKEATLNQFREAINNLEQMQGKIVSYEYRNQGLVYPDDGTQMSELQKAQSQVWYAVKTTKIKSNSLFLIVKTYREGNQHFVTSVNYMDYGDNIPTWLRYPNARSTPK